MSQIITAPNKDEPLYSSVFLAGGITNCKDWQKTVIEVLKDDNITIYNPRQDNFDVHNPGAAYNQILWEYTRLEQMDIFSMYFCDDNSDQPICMYELGRNIVRMQNRFPTDWEKRIIISVESGYKRKNDVIIQSGLAAPQIFVDGGANPKFHAYRIRDALQKIEHRSVVLSDTENMLFHLREIIQMLKNDNCSRLEIIAKTKRLIERYPNQDLINCNEK